MTKGLNGESCAEAVRASIRPGERLTFKELYARTKRRGTWTETTLVRHLMALIVNLPPARLEWRNSDPFLLINTDGTYELYDPHRHPPVV